MDALTKQLLVKIANQPFQGTLMPRGGSFSDPHAIGRNLGRDIQQFPGYAPGTPQFNQYVQQQKFSPQYGQGLYSMQQRMLGVAQDPRAVQGMVQGQMPDMSSVYGDIGAAQFPSSSWSDWGKGLVADASRHLPGPMGTMANAAMQSAEANARQGIQQGVMGSLDRNSPFVQRMMSQAGTTYLGNKINDWTSGMGSFGRGLRGLGQFMLGVGSRMPGYETLMNKGVDWFGPQNMNNMFPATKTSSASPYSHYRVIVSDCGTEVLSPWNHR